MSKLLPPQQAQAALEQLYDQFLHASLWGKSQLAQSYALFALYILTGLLNVAYLGLKYYHTRQGTDSFWIFRTIHRQQALYRIPHSTIVFSFCLILFSALSAGEVFYYATEHQQLRFTLYGYSISFFSWILLAAGAWLTICSHIFSTLCYMDAFKLRTAKTGSILPSPLIFHLFTYGLIAVWVTCGAVLGILCDVAMWKEYRIANAIAIILKNAVQGQATDADVLSLLTLRNQLQAGGANITRFVIPWSWVELCFGYFCIIIYVPFCIISIIHLRKGARQIKEHNSGQTPVVAVGSKLVKGSSSIQKLVQSVREDQSTQDQSQAGVNEKNTIFIPRQLSRQTLYKYVALRSLLVLTYFAAILGAGTAYALSSLYNLGSGINWVIEGYLVLNWVHAVSCCSIAVVLILQQVQSANVQSGTQRPALAKKVGSSAVDVNRIRLYHEKVVSISLPEQKEDNDEETESQISPA